MLGIINAAAEAYRGAIPADCWHEPYMSADELDTEIAAGVEFWGYQLEGALAHAGRHLGRGNLGHPLYERHSFQLLEPPATRRLLQTYWRIGERQIETSVVLANPPYDASGRS